MSRQVARTRAAVGFGLVGLSGLAVNHSLFWLLTDVGSFWISWGAVLATQGSTVWNFVLNDRFVYARVGGRRGPLRAVRQGWTANTMFLLLRVPLLLLLAHAGMNPHWANFTTLVVLFGLRFWISDRFIWSSQQLSPTLRVSPLSRHRGRRADRDEEPRVGPHMALNLRPHRRTKRYYYDIHGIVHDRLRGRAARAGVFSVAPFCRKPELTVSRGYVGDRRMINRVKAIKGPGSFVYREHLGSIGANFRVDLDNRISSP